MFPGNVLLRINKKTTWYMF